MLETTEKAERIRFSLVQHNQELESIKRQLSHPEKLSSIKKAKLISRLPVVERKVTQLHCRLEIGWIG